MDQRTQWNIYFIFQISPVCHRMCIPLFLHHLFFYHSKDLFSLSSPLVCSGGCKIMFWWNFPVSNLPPVSVPSGPPLSIFFLSASSVTPLSGVEPLLPACLLYEPIHESPHMCEWYLDGQNKHALILESWSLLHVRPCTEISPDQHGCRNAKNSLRFHQWLDN